MALDPAGGHYFALEIDGVEVAHFSHCSGIRTEAAVFELEEGGLNDRVHRLVGASKWAPVILKQATNQSHALVDWRERCRAGDHRSRSSGAITVYDLAGRPVERFDLEGVWPVRWEGPSFDSSGSGLAVEELEIAHEGVRVA